MVGDQHVDAERPRRGDAFDACDAVVDGDDQVRLPRGRERDDLGGQPVAELEAVRHQELDRRAHRGETAHPDRAGGRAIGVVIGDDKQPFAALDRAGKPLARGGYAFERLPRRQTGEVVVELRGRRNAARGEYARHDRPDARGAERRRGLGNVAARYFHSAPGRRQLRRQHGRRETGSPTRGERGPARRKRQCASSTRYRNR